MPFLLLLHLLAVRATITTSILAIAAASSGASLAIATIAPILAILATLALALANKQIADRLVRVAAKAAHDAIHTADGATHYITSHACDLTHRLVTELEGVSYRGQPT